MRRSGCDGTRAARPFDTRRVSCAVGIQDGSEPALGARAACFSGFAHRARPASPASLANLLLAYAFPLGTSPDFCSHDDSCPSPCLRAFGIRQDPVLCPSARNPVRERGCHDFRPFTLVVLCSSRRVALGLHHRAVSSMWGYRRHTPSVYSTSWTASSPELFVPASVRRGFCLKRGTGKAGPFASTISG